MKDDFRYVQVPIAATLHKIDVEGVRRRLMIITPLSLERGGEIEVTIEGTLQSLLTEREENARSASVVAGGGIEPPTCGL